MIEGQEWVVLYWTPERRETRFSTQKDALRFAMNLPPKAKVYVDAVNFGDEVQVR